MGPEKAELCSKFEVVNFSRCRIITEPRNLGAPQPKAMPTYWGGCDFMVALLNHGRRQKDEVASFRG